MSEMNHRVVGVCLAIWTTTALCGCREDIGCPEGTELANGICEVVADAGVSADATIPVGDQGEGDASKSEGDGGMDAGHPPPGSRDRTTNRWRVHG